MRLHPHQRRLVALFITFEGIDGCGKSTQARLLADWFKEQGREVILTREPGGTPLAETIRNIVLNTNQEDVAPETEILLYATSRAQHVANLIKPSLEAGKVVISDRYFDSSLAFQGYGLGYDLDAIKQVNKVAMQGVIPDITFIIDIDPKDACQRMAGKKLDRIEARGLEFQSKVRSGFLNIAVGGIENTATRIWIVDGRGSIESIQSKIRDLVVLYKHLKE